MNLDPIGMGYAAVINNTSALLDLLNDPANNTEVPAPDGADFITPKSLLKALYPVNINSQDQFKLQQIFESASFIDEDVSDFRADLVALGGQVATAVNGIVRLLSRAEALFAGLDANGSTESVVISRDDWFAARDS
ncbi:MAG: hypothetical protein HKM98_02485 [Gammaproteobacteria bacterium]|nr:hypothetical protein [Gammaproteobacteria bacterium]